MIRRPLAAVLLLALLCAGCGVRASRVISGVSGPTVPAIGAAFYLVRDGKLTMVTRSQSSNDIATALTLLASDVSAEEAAQGFTTEVPRSAAPIGFAMGAGGVATVSLAIPPTALSAMATNQIACTARTGVSLTGGGVTTRPVYCPGR
ncbi:hypothetical protein [Amycolatopsis minnesotensis]|uniref:Lipoprotein n=1 Tax=Amycolatopsis minnesotensis TaxID=337894 RepID=A0ABP5BJC0_9PSEU